MAQKIYSITFQFFHEWNNEFVEHSTCGRTIDEASQKAGAIARKFGDGWFDVIRIINPLTKEDFTPIRERQREGWR